MSLFKDFFLISSGLVAGIYIEKASEDTVVKQKYNEVLYKLKPLIRDIRTNLLEFVDKSDLNVDLDDLILNVKNSIDILKAKVEVLNEIKNMEDKMNYLRDEIYIVLSSIQSSIKKQREQLENSQTLERQIINDDEEIDGSI